MQFLYNENAKEENLTIDNESFLHLKARRVKINDEIILRNLKDDFIYFYKIIQVDKKNFYLTLINQEEQKQKIEKFSIAISIIDTKILEKLLPFLNELGVYKLILVYADFSQKNFKIDKKRMEKILIQSCQQCGRNHIMEIEIYDSSDDFLKQYENAILLDFEGKNTNIDNTFKNEIFFIGPEGGFSDNERKKFNKKIKFNSSNILRTQTATIALCSKILL